MKRNPKVVGELDTRAPRSQRRYVKVTFTVEMDNIAAMFNRERFDARIARRFQEFNALCELGGPIVLATTEETD